DIDHLIYDVAVWNDDLGPFQFLLTGDSKLAPISSSGGRNCAGARHCPSYLMTSLRIVGKHGFDLILAWRQVQADRCQIEPDHLAVQDKIARVGISRYDS